MLAKVVLENREYYSHIFAKFNPGWNERVIVFDGENRKFELINVYNTKPSLKRKVFIIDDADTMNEQAQNALLKILEEPPKYATIILVTSNKEKLLNTIKSRVIDIQFNSLEEKEIQTILENQGKTVSKEALEFSNGSVSKAIEYLEDETFPIAKELSEILLERDFLKINRKFEIIKSDKNLKSNISSILEKVMYIYYKNLKKDISFDLKIIESIEKTLQSIKRNANVDLSNKNNKKIEIKKVIEVL